MNFADRPFRLASLSLSPSLCLDPVSSAICPGPIYTPLVTSTFSKSNLAGFSSPMKRPGQPVEVATCCVFL